MAQYGKSVAWVVKCVYCSAYDVMTAMLVTAEQLRLLLFASKQALAVKGVITVVLNYHMPLYRPPSEANNLIIQATLGCSFNQCSFCSMYQDKQYQARPLADIVQDIRTAMRYQPETRRVFLADGDAFNLPTDQLLAILDELAASSSRMASS